MKSFEEKCLQFVVHRYQRNKLDTQKALRAFKAKHSLEVPRRKHSYLGWVVTGVAASLLLAFFLYPWGGENEQWTTITAQTVEKSCVLPDGTSVTLSPSSSLQFRNDGEWLSHRRVQLKGKARFQVEPDANHPFQVDGRQTQVVVLGTVFTFDESRPDTATVEVESGKVQFSAKGQSESVILTRGMAAQWVERTGSPQVVRRVATGTFVFENTPLPKVLHALSSHFKVQLTASSQQKRLTASFHEKTLDEILAFIEKVLQVKIEQTPQKKTGRSLQQHEQLALQSNQLSPQKK